jgi:outer membrane protein assembly factor BamB
MVAVEHRQRGGASSPWLKPGVFAPRRDNVITTLNPTNGNRLWQAKDHPLDSQNWIVHGETLHVIAEKLFAINTQTGATLWTKGFDGGLHTLIKGANMLYLSDEITTYALDPTTQRILWQPPLANNGPIQYRGGTLFVAAYKQISGVNATTGAQLWSQPVPSGFAGAFSMNDTASFMHSGEPSGGSLYAVTTATGKALWTSKTMAVVGATYATETSVYALTVSPTTPGTGAVVDALSATTSALQWKVDARGQYPGSLVVG